MASHHPPSPNPPTSTTPSHPSHAPSSPPLIPPFPSSNPRPLPPTSNPHPLPPNINPSPLPPNITLTPPTSSTLRSYRRLITLLLPIPYPASFYTASMPPFRSSFALLALWHDNPAAAPIVVAGIQARVEPCPPATTTTTPSAAQTLYIQTLAVLAPYRGLGIASALLSSLVSRALALHPRLECLYAHVWEANADALRWYERRGFAAEEVVAGYYRRLKPGGARVVRRGVRARAGEMEAGVGVGMG